MKTLDLTKSKWAAETLMRFSQNAGPLGNWWSTKLNDIQHSIHYDAPLLLKSEFVKVTAETFGTTQIEDEEIEGVKSICRQFSASIPGRSWIGDLHPATSTEREHRISYTEYSIGIQGQASEMDHIAEILRHTPGTGDIWRSARQPQWTWPNNEQLRNAASGNFSYLRDFEELARQVASQQTAEQARRAEQARSLRLSQAIDWMATVGSLF